LTVATTEPPEGTESDGVVVRYEPRGAARELFFTRDDEVLIAGPAGTGKSLACLYRVHLIALANPGVRCLIVRKTAVSLTSTTLVSFEKQVAKEALAVGLTKWFGGSQHEAAAYKYSNSSSIVVGGMDKPEKVLSSEYDVIFCDEATELTVTDWEVLNTRLRNGALPWQQIIAACNPSHPQHWIKLRADQGKMKHLISRHRDNPAYVNVDGTPTPIGVAYLRKLDALTGVRRLRLRDGIWAAAEGVIFEQWDESIHLINAFEIPMSWTRWWAVDFGYTNPFVCQFWAEDPDGKLYLYREIYHTRRTVDVHAAKINEYVLDKKGNWREPKPTGVICDHDAEGRAVLERETGIYTAPARKVVTEGIQAVQRRMIANRLFIMRDARVEIDQELVDNKRPTSTIEEIPGYIWATKRSAIDSTGIVEKDEPLKENDHGCDAMRYIVEYRDLAARANVRMMG